MRAPSGCGTKRARARIAAKCAGKPGIVTEESKPTTQIAPLLYDLTSLQREANGRFGFSARTTLSLAQALYEKHKVLTYPRTDSRALPEDYIGTVKSTLEELGETNAYGALRARDPEAEVGAAEQAHLRQREDLRPLRDHPDAGRAQAPERDRAEALRLRRASASSPCSIRAAEHLVTTRITRVEGEPFKTEGKVLVNPGWLAVYGKEAQGEEAVARAGASRTRRSRPRRSTSTRSSRVRRRATTKATLLSAMEGAGKLIEDDELREAMREKGLGTPATRARSSKA